MANNAIVLQGTGLRFEATANATIKPGFLVELMSTGKLRAHATGGGSAEKAFAVEDDVQGKDKDDDYAAAAKVQYEIFRPGDVVYGRLADGETAVIGSKLESNGDGYLRVVDADNSAGDIGVQSIVGVALNAVDMSGSSGVDPSGLIQVRIM